MSSMNVTRAAALAAVLGGLVWVVAAAVDQGGNVNPTLRGVGLLCVLAALAASGYALVPTAPLWLRALVCLATPALGYAVWATVRDAFDTNSLPVLAGGLVALAIGGLVLARTRGDEVDPPVHGHRASR
jgi:hypothetical protein